MSRSGGRCRPKLLLMLLGGLMIEWLAVQLQPPALQADPPSETHLQRLVLRFDFSASGRPVARPSGHIFRPYPLDFIERLGRPASFWAMAS